MFAARLGLVVSVPLWFVSCATAQDDTGLTDGAGAPSSLGGLPGTSGSSAAGATSRAGAAASAGRSSGGATGSAGKGGGASAGAAGLATGGTGGGSAGSGPIFEAGECAATASMTLQYQQTSNDQKQISATFTFMNTGDTPVATSELKIRYFFSNEETGGWKAMVYSAQIDGGTGGYRPLTATATVKALGMSLDGADTYTEVGFAAGATLEKGATGKVAWDMQPNDYNAPDQVQSNDYSYDATASALETWDHVVIYRGAELVWGCTPGGGRGAAGGAP